LTWKDVQFKGEVIFFKESKSLDPGGIGEVVVVGGLAVLRLVRVEVEHVTNATETGGLAVALEHILQVT
jgi:hypothetical protein